jgi:hypothetical protein
MMKLTKGNNITDKLEREQYDHLVKVCEQAKKDAQTRPSDIPSAELLVWHPFDAYRRSAGMDKPPKDLFIDDRAWSKLREKFRLTADAYEELLQALRTP